jgi:hypothetical protein
MCLLHTCLQNQWRYVSRCFFCVCECLPTFLVHYQHHCVCIPHGQHAEQPRTCTTQLPRQATCCMHSCHCSLQHALALIILLCSYSILYTLLIAVRHSLHIQTPCHTQHLSLRALMINNPLSPCCSQHLFTPPVASKPCCTHARQSAACYLHACILVWCLAHVSTSCYS